MKRASGKIAYACVLLLILLSAMVGQKVHIYTEDPFHFAAFCSGHISDNGATSRVVAQCAIDDYWFFPCIFSEPQVFSTYFILLGHPAILPVCFGQKPEAALAALRAPPAKR